MANESNKELTSVWTPANIVTCVRIVFIPVFMIVSALSHTSVAGTDWSTFDGPLAAAAFILYVILSCTDKVDGYLARSRNEITDFGKFLDPIADKLLVFSALLLFLDFGAVTVWSVFIILFREVLLSQSGRSDAESRRKIRKRIFMSMRSRRSANIGFIRNGWASTCSP